MIFREYTPKPALTFLIDTFFPPTEETLQIRNLGSASVQALLSPRSRDNVTILTSFKDKRVSALIHEAKFHHNKKALRLLGELLATYLEKECTTHTQTVIPVPLSKKRRRIRGFNQVSEIVKEALKQHIEGIQMDEHIVKRVRHTKPQMKLRRAERLENIKGAFAVQKPELIRGKNILLIDDVLTTGATIAEAKATLSPHSPDSITCIALAG